MVFFKRDKVYKTLSIVTNTECLIIKVNSLSYPLHFASFISSTQLTALNYRTQSLSKNVKLTVFKVTQWFFPSCPNEMYFCQYVTCQLLPYLRLSHYPKFQIKLKLSRGLEKIPDLKHFI